MSEEFVDEKLVRSCLYNFLGYGNLNSKYWFIGIEEGGAEIWNKELEKISKNLSLKRSLEIRSEFGIRMDFREVWKKYDIELEKLQKCLKGRTVWNYISAFLLAFDGKTIEEIKSKSKNYWVENNEFSEKDGNHFIAELFPLPNEGMKKEKFAYSGRNQFPNIWKSRKDYENDVKDKRLKIIFEEIENNTKLRFIIVYGKQIGEIFKEYLENKYGKNIEFEENSVNGKDFKIATIVGRSFEFVLTPFLGFRGIGYSDIESIVKGHLKPREL